MQYTFIKYTFKLEIEKIIEKLGPGTKSKVQVQRQSLGPKQFTKFGLHTHPNPPPHKLLGHFSVT